MPGSRSIQRPCVSSMSSRYGAKTSKMKRPPGRSRSRAALSADSRAGRSVRCRYDRKGHDERDALADRGIRDVAEAEVEQLEDTGFRRVAAADVEHPDRGVDADDGDAGGRRRHSDPTGADAELDDRPAGLPRLGDVEGHILGSDHGS